MTDYALAEAFVQIRPDTTGFRAEVETKVKSALSGFAPQIKIKIVPDVAGFGAAVKLAVAKALGTGAGKGTALKIPLKLVADESDITRQVALLKARMAQAGLTDFLDAGLPVGKIQYQIGLLKRLLAQAGLSDFLAVNLKPGQVLAGAENLKAAVQRELTDVSLGVALSAGDIAAQAEAIRALVVAALGRISLPVTEQVTPGVVPQVTVPNVGGTVPTGTLDNLSTAAERATAALAGLDTELDAKVKALDEVNAKTDDTGKKLGLLDTLVIKGGTGWGALTGKVKLFGGALGAIPIVGLASYWHLLTDLIIETAAVLIPATVGLIAFGAYGASAATTVYKQMVNVWTVSNALNKAIYPLPKNFQNLASAVRPEVFTLFGEAIVVATRDSGLFAKVAAGVGQALDQLGARAAAALTSGGFGTFIAQAPKDVMLIGDILANLFGIIGNLLHAVPGYAQIVFEALRNLLGAIEAVTGSPLAQTVLKWGLAFHGAVVYIGLAVTAVAFLGNALVALAAKFGLVSDSARFFNATAFVGGIQQMGGALVLLAGELVTVGFGEDAAAAGALVLEGAMAALNALLPVLIVTGIAALVYWLVKASSATNAYAQAVTQGLSNTPVTELQVNLTREQAQAVGSLAGAQASLAHTQKFVQAGNAATAHGMQILTPQYQAQLAAVTNQRAVLAALGPIQKNYNELLNASGHNLAFVSAAGITSNDIIGASKSKMAQLVIEVQAQVAQFKALQLGTGRTGAAMNALNYNADTTKNTLGSLDVDMAKIVQGQDALSQVILGGEQAFIGFDQAILQWGADLGKTPKAMQALTGETAKALTEQSQFYNTVLPGAQKLIDALEMQLAPTSQITAAVATEAKYMLALAGTNKTMQAVIISMINNALGPGTVGFQNLNKWVKANSTSQQGFQSIVASSTINAAKLGGTINQLTQSMFTNDLMMSAHVTPDLKAYTNALVANHGAINAPAVVSARSRLIHDYENAGLSSQAAAKLVDGLTGSFRRNGDAIMTTQGNMVTLQRTIDGLHGKTVTVDVSATASGGVHIDSNAPGAKPYSIFFHARTGGKVPGTGTGDIIPALLEPGEAVIDRKKTRVMAGLFKAMGIPGFAGGGLAGSMGPAVAMSGGDSGIDSALATRADSEAAVSALKNFITGLFRFHGGGGGVANAMPGVITVARYMMQAGGATRAAAAGIGGVVAGESGGNPEAIQGGGGGGMGILQWTPGSSAFPIQPIITGNPQRDMGVQLLDALAYIQDRGGMATINSAGTFSPLLAAWRFSAMEAPAVPGSDIRPDVVNQLYAMGLDKGGWWPSGTLGVNTSGKPELVIPGSAMRPARAGEKPPQPIVIKMASSGHSGFDDFMTSWLCKATVVRGGGSVQVAFGSQQGMHS